MDDWTILIRNAVAVLIILLAISVVLFLAYLGLNAANKGGEKLSNTTAALDQRSFDAYNQTTLSGTTVLSGIKNFQNQPVAIVVRTKAESSLGEAVVYGALLSKAKNMYPAGTFPPTNLTLKGTIGTTSDQLKSADSKSKVYTADVNTRLYVDYQNLNLTSATTPDNKEFINPTAKFKSVLIYDLHNEIVGIYMEQIGTSDEALLQ